MSQEGKDFSRLCKKIRTSFARSIPGRWSLWIYFPLHAAMLSAENVSCVDLSLVQDVPSIVVQAISTRSSSPFAFI